MADQGKLHNERRSLVYIPELGCAASVCTVDRVAMLRDFVRSKSQIYCDEQFLSNARRCVIVLLFSIEAIASEKLPNFIHGYNLGNAVGATGSEYG